MAITTRHAVPADAAALHALAARTFGLANPAGTTQANIDAFIDEHLSRTSFSGYLADPDRIVLIAEDQAGAAAVGYSMLVAGPIEDPDVAAAVAAVTPADGTAIELSKFYVDEGMHGSGVAATLMAATLEAAAKTGASTCWLGVNQENARAAKFYAKNSFEIVGSKRFKVGEVWHDDHVRARPI